MKKINWIFDAESTLWGLEGLYELAKIFLNGSSLAPCILEKIECVCRRGMNGEINFKESLSERMKLIGASRSDVLCLAEKFKDSLAPSVRAYAGFFRKNREDIFLISGGFKDFIAPAAIKLGIKPDHIFANTFEYNGENISGFDQSNPLCQDGGKVEVVKDLGLFGKTIIVGDGTSEAKVRDAGLAQEFWAYVEVVRNESAIKVADRIICDFSEIADYQKTSKIS
jgi:D-3-phosphoglycerate dehydrogenase / 2-oxoglutarate reductase